MTPAQARRAGRLFLTFTAVFTLAAATLTSPARVERRRHQIPAVWVHPYPAPQVSPGSEATSPVSEPGHQPTIRANRSRPLLELRHDWTRLAQCESGGNPRKVSPSGRYRGLVQFSLTSWHAVGMTGDPIAYPPAVQLAAAERLLRLQGRRHAWPVCGRWLR